MRASREKRDDDFKQLFGESQYVALATAYEAYVMIKGVGDFLEKLANGVCIASTGYALVAILILKHSPEINHLMKDQTNRIS